MVHSRCWRFAHFYSRGLGAKSLKNPIGPQMLFAVCFVIAEQTLLPHSLNLTCSLQRLTVSRMTLVEWIIEAEAARKRWAQVRAQAKKVTG